MKKKELVITFADDTLNLNGHINYANVMTVFNQCLEHIKNSPRCRERKSFVVDFSKVISSDSTALALIIELIKYTKGRKINLAFENLSQEITAIAQAAAMDEIIISQ